MSDQPSRASQLHELDGLPLLLAPRELAKALGVSPKRIWTLDRAGKLETFKVRPALGPRCYSRVLIARYLEQQPLYVPSFGRKRVS